MKGRASVILIHALIGGFIVSGPVSGATSPGEPWRVGDRALPLLDKYCFTCHDDSTTKGDVRLDKLGDSAGDAELWASVRDQIRDGLMPPRKEPQPDAAQSRAVVAFIAGKLGGHAARKPNQGNLVPHELLFGEPAAPGRPTAPRVWRLSPEGYLGFLRDVHRGRDTGIVQPFTASSERGIKDFSSETAIDEPSAEILVRNADLIVAAQSGHEIVDGKVRGKMSFALDTPKEDMEKAVLTSEVYLKWSEGNAPKKVIVVPGRIINIVL